MTLRHTKILAMLAATFGVLVGCTNASLDSPNPKPLPEPPAPPRAPVHGHAHPPPLSSQAAVVPGPLDAVIVQPVQSVEPAGNALPPIDLGDIEALPEEWWRAPTARAITIPPPSSVSAVPAFSVEPIIEPAPVLIGPESLDPCSAETPPGAFPWPPRRPSARTRPARYSLFDGTPTLTLGDVSERIESALENAGYRQWSHYSVPGGFATVTQLEQIDLTGKAYQGQDRWDPNLIQDDSLGIFGRLLAALSGAPEGRFRVMALIVTDQTIRPCGEGLERGEAQELVTLGPDRLGIERVDVSYSESHRLSALIYEYQKTGLGEPALVTPTDPDKHMIGSRLSEFLR